MSTPHGETTRGVALLWHGRGVDIGAAMTPLAERITATGVLALATDWNSEAADGGRADLLTSVRHAREVSEEHGHDPGSLVVAGWSLGGTAALSLAVHARRLGISLGGVVLIAPGDGPRVVDPISGLPLPATFPPGQDRCRVDLVYGERDPLATPDLVSGLELRLRSAGWPTTLQALDADHAEVVGARLDEPRERYVRSRTDAATRATDVVAEIVSEAVTSSSR